MTNYTKTMMESLAEVRGLQEDNMDLMRKAAGGAAQTVKMKDGKLTMDMFTASAIMQVYDKVNPANQKKMAVMINKGTKAGMLKLQSFAMKQVKSGYGEEVEEDELDEAMLKDRDYEYDEKEGVVKISKKNFAKVHKDYKGTDKSKPTMMVLTKKGTSLVPVKFTEEVELDEEWTIVMPPAEGGKTVTGLDSEKVMSFIKSKGGSNRDMQSIKKGKSVTFQGKTGGFYKVIKEGLDVAEEVELDEASKLPPHLAKFFDKDGNLKKDAADRIAKGKEKLNIKDVTPKGYGPKEEADLDEAVKVGDNVKVKLSRKGREYIEKGKVTKIEKDSIIVKHDFSRTPSKVKMTDIVKEEVELDEAKYELYHKDFSSAMQHAYKMAKKLHGITIDPKEIDDKVATGPRKPSEGKTNKYRLEGDKGGIQIQVYNKGGSKPFELNMYKEEVEFDVVNAVVERLSIDKSHEEDRQLKDPKKEMMVSKGGKVQVIDKKDWPKFEKKGYVQAEEADLDEGTWKMPKSINQIAPLAKLMKKPIKLGKEGEDAVKVVEPFIGDDELYDDLYAAGKKNPNGDARPAIKAALKRFGFTGPNYEEVDVEEDEVEEQLAKIKGNTPADDGRRAATQDDIDRAEKKGDKKLVKKLKEAEVWDKPMPGKDKQGKLTDSQISKAKARAAKAGRKYPNMVDNMWASNEETDLEEGRMKELHGYIEQGMSAKEIAKKMKLDVKTIEALMAGYGEAYELGTDEYREYLEKLTPGEELIDEKLISARGKDIAQKMMKSKTMKPFAKEVAKMQTVTPDKLERMLPDYVVGKDIHSMFEEADLDEAKWRVEFKSPLGPKDSFTDTITAKNKEQAIDKVHKMAKGHSKDGKFTVRKEELEEASARADAMKAMRRGKKVDPADVDTSASDDDIKAASKHIIMQMRKVISLKGDFKVEFGDKKKVKIPVKIAQTVIQKYNKLKKPSDKEDFQNKVAKSHRDMLTVLKAGYMAAAYESTDTILGRIDKKIKEIREGTKNV